MAYSPIEGGAPVGHPVLRRIAARHRASSAQVGLTWVISHPDVCAIPETGTPRHVRENVGALQVTTLHQDDMVELEVV